jgi:hypothetical protein
MVLLVAVSFTLGATPANRREKNSNFATYQTFAAAHYLACPQIFGDSAVARYLGATSSRDYMDYRRAAGADPAKRSAILEQTRNEIRARAEKAYRSDQIYTVRDVEIEAGAYDVARKGLEFRFPRSIGVGGTRPAEGDNLFAWAELREGAQLAPAEVPVTPEFPSDAIIVWEASSRVLFAPVDPAAAEEFAAASPAGNSVNLGNGGARKALAYLDVEVTSCYSDPQGASYMRGVSAKVVGVRIYAMSSNNRSAGDMVFEWADTP